MALPPNDSARPGGFGSPPAHYSDDRRDWMCYRYILVRRRGRPTQVLRVFGTYKNCWEVVADMWQRGEAHSISICTEDTRHGDGPAGERCR